MVNNRNLVAHSCSSWIEYSSPNTIIRSQAQHVARDFAAMSTNLNYKQVTNVSRRTWDIDAYDKRAKDRVNNDVASENVKHKTSIATKSQIHVGDSNVQEEFIPAAVGAHGPQLSKRAFLKARTNKVKSLDAKIGSTEIVNPDAAATTKSVSGDSRLAEKDSAVTKSGIGWHCKVCDCFLKDSLTYLDHINGRKHQRNLGYSMRVERSTKDQVVSRLAGLVKTKDISTKESGLNRFVYDEIEEDFNAVVKAKDEELKGRKENRKRERKERKKKRKDQKTESSKHKSVQTSGGNESSSSGHGGETNDHDGLDPAIAAMMGFAGFGGGNKNR